LILFFTETAVGCQYCSVLIIIFYIVQSSQLAERILMNDY